MTAMAIGGATLIALAGVAVAHGNGMMNGKAYKAYGADVALDVPNATISDVSYVNGDETTTLLLSARLALPEGATPTDTSRRGYAVADGLGSMLSIEGMMVRAFSKNGTTVALTLPEGVTIATHEQVVDWSPAGATLTYADGTKANLMLRNATMILDGQVLTLALGAEGSAHFGPVHAGGQFGFGHLTGHGPMGGHGGARGFGPRSHR